MAPLRKANERFFPEKSWLYRLGLRVRFFIRNVLNSLIFSASRSLIPSSLKLLIK
jgi:hypothetical protein